MPTRVGPQDGCLSEGTGPACCGRHGSDGGAGSPMSKWLQGPM
jgi:hypothetical protein